ncbi:hypothetical protein SAMN02745751_03146 [Dethiosulfatibacter aminovorans DSM 17477]|uniref:Uncharacterized protein n=1 Tax=Dethiosulfatibacter aminovorans DSM 17477 TaxID=1121476 RepID=A0A1M6LD03_9FIRM|nr:hypothetical protein [Dethiosulfatibacter aminovorans]SHJ69083.1 hypothetical protein SAMN02745751_03146 [Dethiosulfatibacter aminovorans DSM 17477]
MSEKEVNSKIPKAPLSNILEFADTKNIEEKSIHAQLLELIQTNDESFSDVDIQNILSNYIYVSECVRADLKEIENRLSELKKLDSITPADDEYAHKKYRYFARLNRKAQAEITDFYSNDLLKYAVDNKALKYVERKDDRLTMMFLDGRYEYAHFKRYFEYTHDFSTEAKIRFIPGVELIKREEVITEYISLKNASIEKYHAEILRMVIENKSIEYVRDIVSTNHFLARRSEIFDVLVELFNDERYQSFISLAVLQLEGLFYDCCSIIAKKELGDKAGTLIEKAEKVYGENRVFQLSIYPYFAFEVPCLRNEIAHNGIILGKELQVIANEIVLDLYSVTYWACHLTNEKYIPLLMTMDKINEDSSGDENVIMEVMFLELFSNYQISGSEYLEVLAKPEVYNKELNFYDMEEGNVTKNKLSETITFLSERVKSKSFWELTYKLVEEYGSKHKKGKPYELVDFAIKLKNTFMPNLVKESKEKEACINVARLLKTYEDVDKEMAGGNKCQS